MGEIEQLVEHGHIYAEAWVNHRASKNTIVDFGATYNFMTKIEVKRLNIISHQDTIQMKSINSAALLVSEVAKRTPIKMGRTDFVIVKMDDFDIVLGVNFLLEHKVIFILLAKCLVVTGFNPTIIQIITGQPKGVKMMLTLQLRNDLSHDESMLAAIVVVEEGNLSEPTTPCGHYKNTTMQGQKVRQGVSPHEEINHEIDFMFRD